MSAALRLIARALRPLIVEAVRQEVAEAIVAGHAITDVFRDQSVVAAERQVRALKRRLRADRRAEAEEELRDGGAP